MEKVIVNDENIKYVIRYKYNQNNKVIDVSDLDTSKCTNFESLFYYMTNLEEIRGFNMLNLSNVKDMSYMCGGCYSLKSLDLSGLNLFNVANMSAMCTDCHALKELDLSGLDLSKVNKMSSMCNCCYSLKELNLSGLNLSNVNEMSYICGGCYSLVNFKVDEQYYNKFKDIIDEVLAQRDNLLSIDLDKLKIPQHEEE